MRTLDQYFFEYEQIHRNPMNRLIHHVCVPCIMLSTIALLWCMQLGRWLDLSWPSDPWLNAATLLLIPVSRFYLRMGVAILLTMLPIYATALWSCYLIQSRYGTAGFAVISAAVWIVSWIVQLYGHYLEGAKPRFTDDMNFMLIGPLVEIRSIKRLLHR